MWGRCYLNKIHRLEIKIQQVENEIIRLQLSACGVGGMNIGERVQTSGSGDRMSAAVIEIIEMEKKMYAINSEMNKQRFHIIDMIQRIEKPEYVEVLYKRYVERKRWEKIAVEMDYEYDYVRKLCRKALRAFENKYGLKWTQKDQ